MTKVELPNQQEDGIGGIFYQNSFWMVKETTTNNTTCVEAPVLPSPLRRARGFYTPGIGQVAVVHQISHLGGSLSCPTIEALIEKYSNSYSVLLKTHTLHPEVWPEG